ncbi:MAG: Asp-tRNA(Asn)/Glu-tRNA(Gln) amidotransferase subunit GatB [Acidobacteria bacterium]|nr:Asp-tRNA(Asn)/Glu-tRNA(Gln) amidotransferase subunit GatB [Acidobacteriota bacterium]
MSLADWEPVIGLEVHAQLRTKSKAFCGCPVVFGAPPNTAVCPVCLGYPGTLPVLNREMVALALRVMTAMDCTIHERSIFARKNYFYPDLPKGYQISQYDRPLATGGGLEVSAQGRTRRVTLNRIHLEEDAGKSMHEFPWDDVPGGVSLVDLNRAGTPLVEIVTEPDIGSAEEAFDYLGKLRRLVRWVDASDGNMEEGSLRCDANVSVRRKGETRLGTKIEVKNLNSIAHVKKAIEHEFERQVEELEAGRPLRQETRLFDPGAGVTKPMRSKEEAMDYRYFQEPDLGDVVVPPDLLDEVRASMPELPAPRARRLESALGLPAADAETICSARPFADYYESAVAHHAENPKAIANWLLSDLLGRMTDADRLAGRVPLPAAHLAGLVRRIDDGTISGKIAKELLPELIASGKSPDALIDEKGMKQVSDEGPIRDAIAAIVNANPKQVETYRSGKTATFGWFVGQVMKATSGKANPAVVNRLLKEALEG